MQLAVSTTPAIVQRLFIGNYIYSVYVIDEVTILRNWNYLDVLSYSLTLMYKLILLYKYHEYWE